MILNDAFPMLVIIWPIYLLLLIPIIFIESRITKRYLQNVAIGKILWPITIANIFSTLIGIPVTWGLLALIEFIWLPKFFEPIVNILTPLEVMLNVTAGAAWIAPYSKSLFWTIPVAAMFLLIPFYFVSVWIESLFLTKIFKISFHKILVKKSCWRANLASYLLLFIFFLGILLWSFYDYFRNFS